ncbi:MAG: insulinase family protein [Deltaproteobacteria bacterium]|nr:insulinase family protein [Deltaproteobacteria bacterium]
MAMLTSIGAAPAVASADGARFRTEAGTLVLLEEDHALPIVSLSVTARTGSTLDPPGKEGLARIASTLLRRGVPGLSADRIDELVDRLGGVITISADHHSITIGGQVIRRNLEPFAELLSRMISVPTLASSELERLKRETIAEIVAGRDDDRELAMNHFRRVLMQGHAYGRPPMGTTRSVARITRQDVRRFFRSTFVAQNLILGAAGDVSEEELKDLVDDHFDDLRSGERPRVRLGTARTPRGRRLVIVDKPDRTQTQVFIGQVGIRAADEDYFPLTVANTVFGGTFTARLMKEVRSKRGWSYGASSRIVRGRSPDAFYLWTFPAATDALACIRLELDLLHRFVEDGITQSELDFAKSFLENNFAFEVDTAEKRLEKRIDAEVLRLGRDYYRDYVQRIRGVDLRSANAAVQRHLGDRDLTIVLVATASELREALTAQIPDLAGVDVVPFDSD